MSLDDLTPKQREGVMRASRKFVGSMQSMIRAGKLDGVSMSTSAHPETKTFIDADGVTVLHDMDKKVRLPRDKKKSSEQRKESEPMPTNERQFRGAIKKVSVQGETKIDKDGAITAEPEVILTIALPLDRRSIEAMGFLAAVKQGGECELVVKAMQGVMEFNVESVSR